ncbi:lysine 2,3-aminomutase, partial [bacterium]|nr:lysine 2,3-aminomutase [bacterium]
SVISQLMRRLLKMRVRPYYLLHADLVRGTDHFRTPIDVGLQIMKHLRRTISGMAVPTYILDLPGGGGKVPLLPEYIIQKTEEKIVIQNDQGRVYQYPNSRSSIPFEKLNYKALIEN